MVIHSPLLKESECLQSTPYLAHSRNKRSSPKILSEVSAVPGSSARFWRLCLCNNHKNQKQGGLVWTQLDPPGAYVCVCVCVCMCACVYVCVCECPVVSDFATPWTVPHQALLSMGFPRQEHCSGLPFSFSREDSLWPRDPAHITYDSCMGRWVLDHERHLGSPDPRGAPDKQTQNPSVWVMGLEKKTPPCHEQCQPLHRLQLERTLPFQILTISQGHRGSTEHRGTQASVFPLTQLSISPWRRGGRQPDTSFADRNTRQVGSALLVWWSLSYAWWEPWKWWNGNYTNGLKIKGWAGIYQGNTNKRCRNKRGS